MPEVTARSRVRVSVAEQAPKPTPAAVKDVKAKPSRAMGPFMKALHGVDTRPNTAGREAPERYDTPERKASMIVALEEFLGVVHYACQKTGVSRATHYFWMNQDADYAVAVRGTRDVALDYVEGQLLTNIRNGDATSAIFYLKTQGKQRGYVERSEITGADGGAISVQMSVEQVREDLPLEGLKAVLLKTIFKDGTPLHAAALNGTNGHPLKQLPSPQ